MSGANYSSPIYPIGMIPTFKIRKKIKIEKLLCESEFFFKFILGEKRILLKKKNK